MTTRMPPGDYDDDGNPVWTTNLDGHSGSLHSVSGPDGFAERENRVRMFREVVAEITHGRIPVPPKRGPGF